MGKINKSFIVVLVIGLLIPACLLAQGDDSGSLRMATVSGNAFLEGETDHSGIMVVFDAQSPSAITDTAYTMPDGSYAIGLSDGIYEMVLIKNGFLTYTHAELLSLIGNMFALPPITLQAGMVISGYVSGVWEQGSTFLVEADITVGASDTLIIESGVKIKFSDNKSFHIYGKLIAQGTESDSIKFTSSNLTLAAGNWDGLYFHGFNNNNSILEYSIVEYGGSNFGNIIIENEGSWPQKNITIQNCNLRSSETAGIYMTNDRIDVLISDSEFSRNMYAIRTDPATSSIGGLSNIHVLNCEIYNNTSAGIISGCSYNFFISENNIYNNQRGIQLNYRSKATISDNIIRANSYGIDIGSTVGQTIKNNILDENYNGIYLWAVGSNSYIGNNTITNNSSKGIYVLSYADNIPIISNNIFYNNIRAIQHSLGTGTTNNITYNVFYNNDIYPQHQGFGVLATTNANGDSVDTYFNIFQDPLFVSIDELADSVFYLSSESPAIDAGTPDSLDADGTIRDLGAYYYHQGDPGVPVTDFTSNVTSGYLPLYVQFTNTTIGAANSYEWVFGDNTTSTQANPVHAYTIAGPYSVSLTATGPGGVDTEVKTDYITVTTPHYPPEVSFSGSPTAGTTPLTVNFSSSVVNDLDSLRWYFGDGGTSTIANPTYTYQDVGTYSVTLHAYGPYGTDTETKSSYINVIAPNAVTANFSALPLTGIAPMGVQFTNSSVGTIDSVKWTFGDGGSSTAMNPAHEYQSEGVYAVSLNVYGPVNNDVMTHENYVTVYDARPMITSVSDVPNDQGGKVLLRWNPSGFDGVIGSSINQYSLWQKYNNEWISINNTLAMQSESYTYLASTYNDSTASGIGWSRFKIIAHTSNPATFFTSPVDSGYSVDNIPPEAPGQLLAVALENDVSLEWGVSNESNFMYYKVLRNWEVIAEQTSSQYLDSPGSFITPLYYQVASVDDAGNESPGTNEALVDNTNLNWFLNIRADHGDEYNDNDNYLGVADDATNDYDVNYDVLEPPSPPNGYVGLYFPHPEWSHALGDNFTQDIKPAVSLVDSLQEWNFDVIGDQSGIVDLTFYLSENFPEDATTILKNIETGESFLIVDGETVSLTISPLVVEHFSISIGNNSPNEPVDVSLNLPSTTGFSSLTWVDNSDNEDGYIIFKSSDGTTFSYVDSLVANTVSFTGTALTDLAINTEYYFNVKSYNLAATSVGVADSLFTLSNIPSAPIIIDSTLTTIDVSITENENPSHTEFAIGVTGGVYGTTIHYIQSGGSVLGDTAQVWATKDLWGTITILGLEPETEYSTSVKSRNGDLVESQFGSSASRSTGNFPTVTLIDPLGPAILQSNTGYSINWLMSNPSFVDSVFLYYSSDSGSTYELLSSLSDVDSYSWTTPSEYLTYGGKIKVGIKDESGLFRYDESESPFVIVGDSLSSPIETGWALWGVPLTPFLTPIADNLEDDFSGGWWSFAYENDGYIINSDLVGGEGYWLATDAPAVIDVQGQPATAATTLELAQGWELLTNPLVTDVDRDSLLITKDDSTIPFSEAVSNGWVASEFYHYSTSLGGYEMPEVLEPWKGYWFGVVDSGVSVTFPIHSTIDQLARSTRDILTDADWRVHLEIQAGSAHDWALIGVDSNATDNFDVGFDVPKPPTTPNPNHVNIGFNHPDWNPVLGESYIVDIRSPLEDPAVKEWEVQLSSTIADSLITVSWTIDNIPEDMVYSFEYGTESINLLEQGSLELPYSSEVISFILKAEKSPVSAEYEKVIPTEYSLHQNFPNPFNPTTTIRYGLPEASQVTLYIYDIKGRKVRSIIGEHQTAGSYEYLWNGFDDSGQPVSTGLYLTRLQAGSYSKTIKMLYLK